MSEFVQDFFVLKAVISKLICPCGAANYVRDEDFEDASKMDPQTVKCWKCGNVYWIDENAKQLQKILNETSGLTDDYDEEGLKRPDLRNFLEPMAFYWNTNTI